MQDPRSGVRTRSSGPAGRPGPSSSRRARSGRRRRKRHPERGARAGRRSSAAAARSARTRYRPASSGSIIGTGLRNGVSAVSGRPDEAGADRRDRHPPPLQGRAGALPGRSRAPPSTPSTTAIQGSPRNPATLETPTMCPDPRAIIPGRTASIDWATPRTLTSSIARSPSVSRSGTCVSPPIPAQATRTSIGPTSPPDRGPPRCRPSRSRHVGRPRRRRSRPSPGSSAGDLGERAGVAVDQAEPVAPSRPGPRRRPADPARGAGQRGRSARSSDDPPAGRRLVERLEERPERGGRTPPGSPRAPGAARRGRGPSGSRAGARPGSRPSRGTARLAVEGQDRLADAQRSARRSARPRPWSRRRRWSCPSRRRRFTPGRPTAWRNWSSRSPSRCITWSKNLPRSYQCSSERSTPASAASWRKACQWPQRLRSSRCRRAGK